MSSSFCSFKFNGLENDCLLTNNIFEDVKSLLYLSLLNIVVVEYRLPDRILIELALFIALLHILVSADICKSLRIRFFCIFTNFLYF